MRPRDKFLTDCHVASGADFAGIMDAAERAWKAHQAFLETPEGRKAREDHDREQLERDEQEALLPYRRRRIPGLIAKAILYKCDHRGLDLRRTRLDDQLEFHLGSERQRLVLILGKVGTGKTMAACRWLAGVELGLYSTARHFCRLSGNMSDDRPDLRRHETAAALVLDEVGLEDKKHRQRIEDLLHTRYEDDLPTVVIANMAPGEFLSAYGDRVDRRVWANGFKLNPTEVLCPGERKRQSKEG